MPCIKTRFLTNNSKIVFQHPIAIQTPNNKEVLFGVKKLNNLIKNQYYFLEDNKEIKFKLVKTIKKDNKVIGNILECSVPKNTILYWSEEKQILVL